MTSNDNQSVEDSREYLREQLAPRIRSLFDLRRAGGLPLEFISFPHAPHERTFHNRSKQEYPLGCYRIPTGLFVGGHGLLLAGQDFILMEQNGDTIIEESYTAVPGQLEPVVPRIPQCLSLLAAPSYNFYHWLVDSLPKVIVAEACGFTGMYLIPMAIMNKDAHEGLALLGIPLRATTPDAFSVGDRR